MKKVLLILVALSFAVSVYAAENTFMSKSAQKLRDFGQKVEKTSDDVDAKVEAQQKRSLEQQRKYEAKKAERDRKIQEKQKQRQEAYNATQKRLEEKREQLRKLLEE